MTRGCSSVLPVNADNLSEIVTIAFQRKRSSVGYSTRGKMPLPFLLDPTIAH